MSAPDRFDELAAALHKEWEWPVEAQVLAEALRETDRAAERRGELKGLTWALDVIERFIPSSLSWRLKERIAEIKKGGA